MCFYYQLFQCIYIYSCIFPFRPFIRPFIRLSVRPFLSLPPNTVWAWPGMLLGASHARVRSRSFRGGQSHFIFRLLESESPWPTPPQPPLTPPFLHPPPPPPPAPPSGELLLFHVKALLSSSVCLSFHQFVIFFLSFSFPFLFFTKSGGNFF